MIIYILDSNDIWTGEQRDIDPYKPVPPRFSTHQPPELYGTQVAKWINGAWKVIESYPCKPVPIPSVQLDVLSTDKWVIAADEEEFATVTYTDTSTVYFAANDDVYAIEPVSSIATIEITADAPGSIRVQVKDKQLIITAVEVQS